MFKIFKNLFKKKEKPVCQYSSFDIGSKAIHTNDCSLFPTEVTCYHDRVVFCLNVFDHRVSDDPNDMACVTVTAPQTGERLIPLTVAGLEFFWDMKDLAFRRKLMPEGEPIELAPAVHIYPNEVLTIGRAFAEEYLSPQALSYAALQDEERYIWFYPDFSSAPAVFEVPKFFTPFIYVGENNMDVHPLSSHPLEVVNHMSTFTLGYLDAMELTIENWFNRYREHLNRELPGIENH